MSATPEVEEQLVSDIENKLKEDADGEFRQALHDELTDRIAAIDKLLKAGAAPDEYKRLEAIKTGLEAADFVRERLWLYYHHSSS